MISFGNYEQANLATVGLNPSNREFVDSAGDQLSESSRRFPTLKSLGLRRWSEASPKHYSKVLNACKDYFHGNPYDLWFRQLDNMLKETGNSFYSNASRACHLDLVPFATSRKWTEMHPTDRARILELAGDSIAQVILLSSIRVIVLNGRSVVDAFQKMAGCILEESVMPDWSLKRNGILRIKGLSYCGEIRHLGNTRLDRSILVLGYNHNIQSSYGVTNDVRKSIGSWIAKQATQFI